MAWNWESIWAAVIITGPPRRLCRPRAGRACRCHEAAHGGSFTSITGASAQAPRHSHCCRVNRPSGVVSPIETPSFFFQVVMQRLLPVAQLARQIGAHVELVLAHRLLVVHVVEGRDFMHGDLCHAQIVSDRLALGADVALLLLNDGQTPSPQTAWSAGCPGHFARKPRLGRFGNHRSISPNTISMVPMMATASRDHVATRHFVRRGQMRKTGARILRR